MVRSRTQRGGGAGDLWNIGEWTGSQRRGSSSEHTIGWKLDPVTEGNIWHMRGSE